MFRNVLELFMNFYLFFYLFFNNRLGRTNQPKLFVVVDFFSLLVHDFPLAYDVWTDMSVIFSTDNATFKNLNMETQLYIFVITSWHLLMFSKVDIKDLNLPSPTIDYKNK